LNAVKNVGETACRAIVAAREAGGRFESLWEFTERVDPQVVNRRALEALDSALNLGAQRHADVAIGQASIFDLADGHGAPAERHHPELATDEYEKAELLRLEKETLGLWVSEHPLAGV